MLLLIPRVRAAAAVSSLALNAATAVSGFTAPGKGYLVASNKQSSSWASPHTDIGTSLSTASRLFMRKIPCYPKLLGTLDCKRNLAASDFSDDGEITQNVMDLFQSNKTNDTATMMRTITSDLSDDLPPLWENFQPGDYYVWRYTANDVPSSYERYEVTNVTIGESVVVEIEMATHFPPEANEEAGEEDCENDTDDACNTSRKYDVHHRMELNLSDNLAAIDSRNNWKLKRFDYKWYDPDPLAQQQGLWEWRSAAGQGENVQAFEEKFDCFAMVRQYNKKRKYTPPGSGEEGLGDEQEDVTAVVTIMEERQWTLYSELLHVARTERHRYTGSWYGMESAGRLCGVALAKEFDAEFSFSLIEYGREGDGGAIDLDVKVKLGGGGDAAAEA